MRISGFHINGFGVYHDQAMPELPPGLVVFLGENESGKTTLLEFIRTVLFGFRRKDAYNIYPPLRGGAHGGRLAVVRQDGTRYTVERLGRLATIARDGGSPLKGEPGEQLLGGLDRDTFMRIFAIGLDELQGLKLLNDEGVRSRLFSAGAGLGAASVPEAMNALDKELVNLLSPRGQRQINQLLQQLKATEIKIKELQGLSAAYAENQARREGLEEEIRRNKGEMDNLRRRFRRLEQLEQARQPWTNRNLARERGRELEFARNFPPHGLERWEALTGELDRLLQGRQSREQEAGAIREQLGRIEVDEALLTQREAVESLSNERELLAKAQLDYPLVKQSLEQAEAEFQRKLQELGGEWDEARLARVDTSVQVRQQVQEFARQLAAAEREGERLQAEARALNEAALEARRQAEAAAQRRQQVPEPPVASPEELRQKQDAVRVLRHWLHQRDLMTAQLPAKLAAQKELTDRLASLERQRGERYVTLPGWLWVPGLVMGLALAGWMGYQRSYYPAGLLGGLTLGLALLFFLVHRRQETTAGERRTQLQEEMGQVEGTFKRLAEDIRELRQRAALAEAEMERVALGLGRSRPEDLVQLEQLVAWLEQAEDQLREWQVLEQEERKAAEREQEARSKWEKAGRAVAAVAQTKQALEADWSRWLAEHGFKEYVRPEAFEAVLQTVESARAAARNLAEYRRRVDQMETYLVAVRSRIARILDACARRAAGAEPGLNDLDALKHALNLALAGQQERGELEAKLAAIALNQANLQQLIQEKETELEGLRSRAGAAGEEEFRRLAAAWEEWRTYERRREESEIALLALSGTPESQKTLEAELAATEPLQLQEEKESLQKRLTELEEQVNRDRHESGTLDNALGLLAHNEELGQQLLEERTLKQLLSDAVRRWSALAVGRHLLQEARGVYERERQPAVIREADRFLSLMAHNRYRLVASVGEHNLHLEDRKSLSRTDDKCWSAGLADQVYLAVRLGLAREFGRHSEPLPVILDDVLVKFDPRRRLNAARLILDFAQEQQVLLFSCHPEFMEILETGRREFRPREARVTYFTIADGVIHPASPPA